MKWPKRGRDGDELTWTWLNKVLTLVRTATVNLGPNSGLSMIQNDAGTFLRVSNTSNNSVYFCQPTGTVSGASGTWPTVTPAGFTADIYIASGDTLTLFESGAQCYNWYGSGLVADKTCYMVQDDTGAYVVVTQSCL
jgi:hypothetical protein